MAMCFYVLLFFFIIAAWWLSAAGLHSDALLPKGLSAVLTRRDCCSWCGQYAGQSFL